jgi:hypothetical protein
MTNYCRWRKLSTAFDTHVAFFYCGIISARVFAEYSKNAVDKSRRRENSLENSNIIAPKSRLTVQKCNEI